MPRSYAGKSAATARGGRPPKFAEPRRPVTVTLPLRTIDLLSAIDGDRARAIVRAADVAAGDVTPAKPVEVVSIDDRTAIVIIAPCKPLAKLKWLRTVEIAPNRLLVSLEPGTSVDTLEVALLDLLDGAGRSNRSDRIVLEELLAVVRRRRRDRTISKGEILFVPSEPARRSR